MLEAGSSFANSGDAILICHDQEHSIEEAPLEYTLVMGPPLLAGR